MDRIRKALDLAREQRVQPGDSTAQDPAEKPEQKPAERPPTVSVPAETSGPSPQTSEKPRPVVSIVEQPQPVVSAVESHGAVLRSVEKLRPVVVAAVERHPGDVTILRPGPSTVEQSRPTVTTVETPRPSAAWMDSPTEPFAPATESPSSSDSAAERPRRFWSESAPRVPTAFEYTKTKTFSPDTAWLKSNRIVDVSGSDAAAAAFRILRTQVLQRMLEHHWRSIAVLSPGSDDGRTTTAVNLAISLASDLRHTVLLVEFDLKQPIIAKRLGIDAQVGADDVLRGDAGIEESLYHPDGYDRFVVMPGRAPMGGSSEMLTGPRCREIVAELRARYPDRLLVFDLPPVLGTDDALAFVPLVECALVVVAEGMTPRADLLRCMELLRNTPVVGTVLNLSTAAGAAYG
jgi:Mrp family chromosome partitioning ATPase